MEQQTRPDLRTAKRRIAWMFLTLWIVVLGMTIYRVTDRGDLKITLGVATAAVLFCLYRLYDAYRPQR